MNANQKRKCRFCDKTINQIKFQIKDEITMEILDVLLLKLNLDMGRKLVICDPCTQSLQESFEFKSMCLYSEDVLFPYITPDSTVDLLDVVLEKNMDYKQTNTVRGQQLCRLCIKIIEGGFSSLTELQNDGTQIKDVLQKHIPELNLAATNQPVICRTCTDSLNMLSTFLTMCLKSEYQCGDRQLQGSEDIWEDVKIEGATEVRMEVEYYKNAIMKEEADIKAEESEGGSSPEKPCTSYPEISKKRRKRGKYKTRPRIVTTVRCETCPYTTTNIHHLQRHLIVHRQLSEVKVHNCDKCPFTTKYEVSHRQHMKRHQAERPTIKCEFCNFKSISKTSFNRHVRHHNNEINSFECEVCGYKTIDKSSFTYHSLNHKNASEVTILKCYLCKYETRHKQQMVTHTKIHIDPSKITMIECDICTFKTKTKNCLRNHMKTHKDPSELKMYPCDVCSYETKYRYTLKSHMRIHAKPGEVTMYKCDICAYESKYERTLNNHVSRMHQKQTT